MFSVDEDDFGFNHMNPEMDFMSFAAEMNKKIEGGWMRRSTLEKVMGDMEEQMSATVQNINEFNAQHHSASILMRIFALSGKV